MEYFGHAPTNRSLKHSSGIGPIRPPPMHQNQNQRQRDAPLVFAWRRNSPRKERWADGEGFNWWAPV